MLHATLLVITVICNEMKRMFWHLY